MHGEFSVMGTALLLAIAVLFSTIMVTIGRRIPASASRMAYGTAVAVLVAHPLLAEAPARALDRLVGLAGVGLLLDHIAFMAQFCGLLLTFVLATHQWARRHLLALGGAGLLTLVFVLCWLVVQWHALPEAAIVFYGLRAGQPPAVFWMNVSMGSGLVYIAAWNLIEFTYFLRQARTTYEYVFTGVGLVLYALSCVAGTFTIAEAVGHQRGWDPTVIVRAKAPLTVLVTAAALGLLGGQLWLRPLWRRRRQLLARYVAPELMQLHHSILNLMARQAEIHLDIQYEAYANRAIVDTVAARCHAAAVAANRRAVARMATILLTTQRTNMIDDPQYGRDTSWDDLMAEATTKIDQSMAFHAWERAREDSYIYQDIYILMFLVLDSPRFRQTLLIQEAPPTQPWHEALADLIATAMQEHGQTTPRALALAERGPAERPAAPRRVP